jgi:class 3 adenylate cyclase
LVGNVGAAERFNYTVLGQAVRHAEWLEQLNKEQGTLVLVSERTAMAVAHAMLLREVGTFSADGEPMRVFELVGEKQGAA